MSYYKFKFTINLSPGMVINEFRVENSILNQATIDSYTSGNVIKGQIVVLSIKDTVAIEFNGTSNQPNFTGTFNMTYNKKKFFSEDKGFTAKDRIIDFYEPKVKIP